MDLTPVSSARSTCAFNVEPEEHRALVDAKSIGAHFAKHIRPQFLGEAKTQHKLN